MPTTIDSGLTIQDALNADHAPHVFTMSNGDLVVLYYNGTNLVWRSKSGGAWSAATTITLDATVSPAKVSYWTRSGDTIMGIASPDPITGTTNADFFELVYAPATHTLGQTNRTLDNADGNEKAAGAAYSSGGAANDQLFLLHGNAAGNFGTIQELSTTTLGFGVDQTPTMGDFRSSARTGVVSDGTTTAYLIYACASSGTAFKVERFTAGTNADNVESPPAPAANPVGITAVYDGSNYVFVINENNANLRVLTRTGANTYGSWTTIVTDAGLTDQPVVCVKSNGDLAVFYRTTTHQANGEIWVVQRTSGTWGSPALLAGGAATGWRYASCAASDLNDAGNARVLYVTGTASTWTLVEDNYAFTTGGGSLVAGSATLQANAAIAASAQIVAPSDPLAADATLTASPAQLVMTAATAQANAVLSETAAAQVVAPSAALQANAALAETLEAVLISSNAAPLAANAALAVSAAQIIVTHPAAAQANAALATAHGATVVEPSAALPANAVLAATGGEIGQNLLVANAALVVSAAQIITPTAPLTAYSVLAEAAQIVAAAFALQGNATLAATGTASPPSQPGVISASDTRATTVGASNAALATVGTKDVAATLVTAGDVA